MDGIFGYFSGAAAGGATQVNAKSRVPDDDDNIEFAKEDLDAWLVLFKKFDLNNDGGIDMTEFDLICESAAKERGDPPRDSQWIIRAFHEADKDGSGHIDFREFVMVAYRHKATVVDPMYEQNYGAGSKKDKETASRAARHVTSVPVLRETLELAKQSKDPALVREAQRLLYALGDAGKATLAGLVFEEGGDYHDSKDGVKRLVPGNRGNVLGELALGGVGNLVDAAVVRDQVQGAQLAEPRSMREDNEWTDLWTALPSEHDIETLFSYMQYQGLTNMLAISYIERFNSYGHNFALPESFTAWQNYLGWMNIFNLDLQAMAVWAGAYARGPAYEVFSNLPYSSLYLLVTAALPLAISFINLVLFYPLYQVIWLFLTVLSLVLTISCVLAKSILSEERLAVVGGGTLSPAFLSMLLYIGVGTFAAMLLALAIYRWYLMWLMLQKAQNKVDVVTRNLGRADTIALRQFLKTEKEEHEGPPPPLNDWIIVRNVWFTIVCALFATLDLYTNKALNIGPVIGIVLGVAGFVSIVYNLLTFFEKGRVLLRTAGRIIDRTAVSFFLMLLSILYMPITRMLFAIWLSSAAVCPAGTRFPIFANEISSSGSQWLASGVVECEPCEFESFNKYSLAWNVDFDSDGQCSTKFCPGETSVRSFQDPRLGYFDVILPFYAPASLLMLLGFTLGVPYLYYNIITKHTKMFSDTEDGGIEVRESRVGMETMKKHQGDVEWDYRVSGSNNRAKSLYSIFEFQFRFTKLVLVLQKLLIIAIVIFLYEYIVPAGKPLLTPPPKMTTTHAHTHTHSLACLPPPLLLYSLLCLAAPLLLHGLPDVHAPLLRSQVGRAGNRRLVRLVAQPAHHRACRLLGAQRDPVRGGGGRDPICQLWAAVPGAGRGVGLLSAAQEGAREQAGPARARLHRGRGARHRQAAAQARHGARPDHTALRAARLRRDGLHRLHLSGAARARPVLAGGHDQGRRDHARVPGRPV